MSGYRIVTGRDGVQRLQRAAADAERRSAGTGAAPRERPGAGSPVLTARVTGTGPDGDGNYAAVITAYDPVAAGWEDGETAVKLMPANGERLYAGRRYPCRPSHDDGSAGGVYVAFEAGGRAYCRITAFGLAAGYHPATLSFFNPTLGQWTDYGDAIEVIRSSYPYHTKTSQKALNTTDRYPCEFYSAGTGTGGADQWTVLDGYATEDSGGDVSNVDQYLGSGVKTFDAVGMGITVGAGFWGGPCPRSAGVESDYDPVWVGVDLSFAATGSNYGLEAPCALLINKGTGVSFGGATPSAVLAPVFGLVGGVTITSENNATLLVSAGDGFDLEVYGDPSLYRKVLHAGYSGVQFYFPVSVAGGLTVSSGGINVTGGFTGVIDGGTW